MLMLQKKEWMNLESLVYFFHLTALRWIPLRSSGLRSRINGEKNYYYSKVNLVNSKRTESLVVSVSIWKSITSGGTVIQSMNYWFKPSLIMNELTFLSKFLKSSVNFELTLDDGWQYSQVNFKIHMERLIVWGKSLFRFR